MYLSISKRSRSVKKISLIEKFTIFFFGGTTAAISEYEGGVESLRYHLPAHPRKRSCFNSSHTTPVFYSFSDSDCFYFSPDNSYFLTSPRTTPVLYLFTDNNCFFLSLGKYFLLLSRQELFFISQQITATDLEPSDYCPF